MVFKTIAEMYSHHHNQSGSIFISLARNPKLCVTGSLVWLASFTSAWCYGLCPGQGFGSSSGWECSLLCVVHVLPVHQLRDIGLFLLLACYQYCCYEHLCTSCVWMDVPISLGETHSWDPGIWLHAIHRHARLLKSGLPRIQRIYRLVLALS